MKTGNLWILAAGIGLAALGAQPAAAQRGRGGEAELAKLLAGRTAGRPVSCIGLRLNQSSRIIDRTAIVYGSGRTIYVNRPRSGAKSLDDDDVLVTRTSGSQLCRLDTVRLVDRTARVETGFVSLGNFVPYTRPRAARR
jgi:hypothetical protein